MTNEQHNKYIAYTFLGYSGFQLLMLLFMVGIFSMVFFIPTEPGEAAPPRGIFGIMIAFVTVFQLAFTVPSAIAAIALLKRKPWARMASIIAAVTSVMSVPFGTAASVYAFWFFFGDNWKSIYPEKSEEFGFGHRQIPYGVESQREAYRAENREWQPTRPFEPPDWR